MVRSDSLAVGVGFDHERLSPLPVFRFDTALPYIVHSVCWHRVFAIRPFANVPQPSALGSAFLNRDSFPGELVNSCGRFVKVRQPIPSSTALCLVNWIFAYSTI